MESSTASWLQDLVSAEADATETGILFTPVTVLPPNIAIAAPPVMLSSLKTTFKLPRYVGITLLEP